MLLIVYLFLTIYLPFSFLRVPVMRISCLGNKNGEGIYTETHTVLKQQMNLYVTNYQRMVT